MNLPIIGVEKLHQVCKAFGIPDDTDDVKALAGKLADVLLADLSRATPDDYEAIKALAPAERQKFGKIWTLFQSVLITKYSMLTTAPVAVPMVIGKAL